MELELSDIQGYVVRGYKYMMYSRYVMLNITEPALAKKFIKNNVVGYNPCKPPPHHTLFKFCFYLIRLKSIGNDERKPRQFYP